MESRAEKVGTASSLHEIGGGRAVTCSNRSKAGMVNRRELICRFNLEELADLICEFTQDGKRKKNRDVIQWFRWLERKAGIKKSFIHSAKKL
jgi:hypothetical protein